MLNTCMWACKRKHAGMKPLNNHVRLYTVAFGGFHQKRQRSSACEVVCLVHQSLLHCIISYQNNRPLPAQVQCHHRTIDFTELEEDTDILQKLTCNLWHVIILWSVSKTHLEKTFESLIFLQLWQVSYERKCSGSWRQTIFPFYTKKPQQSWDQPCQDHCRRKVHDALHTLPSRLRLVNSLLLYSLLLCVCPSIPIFVFILNRVVAGGQERCTRQ